MCGRVTLTFDRDELLVILNEVYEVHDVRGLPPIPNYNLAPSNGMLTVIQAKDQRRGGVLTWGFVPHWAKEEKISHGLINARSESIDVKPTFKESFEKRRCLIFANHFYEWKRGEDKRPFLFQVTNQPLMPMAGIYAIYTRKDGSKLSTCAIVTCEPNATMAPIHHRMPVILTPETIGTWLSHEASPSQLKALMVPYAPEYTKATQVSTYVNSVKHTDHKCIEPLEKV